MTFVLYEKKGHIGYITLNRPERMNAIGDEMRKELDQIDVEVGLDDDVWVTVVSANGRAFSTGIDIKEMSEHVKQGQARFARLRGRTKQDMVHGDLLERPHWKPSVAAVHGYCLGRGLMVALDFADIRICSPDAKFGLPEVKWNFAPIPPVNKVAARISPSVALWLALTADDMTAEQALMWGLVIKIVPKEQLLQEATKIAEKLCGYGPASLRATKRFFYQTQDMTVHQAVRFSDLLFRQVEATSDASEGVKAFVEKRTPKWQAPK